jgi:hypothetical protein
MAASFAVPAESSPPIPITPMANQVGLWGFDVERGAGGVPDRQLEDVADAHRQALEYAAFRGALVKLTAYEPVADNTDTVVPWDATEFDTDGFWDSGNPTCPTVPSGMSLIRLLGNIRWQSSATG